MRNRTAAVILATAALLSTSTAIANATPSLLYSTLYRGPFATQATCTTQQVANNTPPDELTTGCFFSTTSPGRGAGPGPGWYYRAMVLIS